MTIRAVLVAIVWISLACGCFALMLRLPAFSKPTMVIEKGKERGPVSWLRRSKDGKLLLIQNAPPHYQVGTVFRMDNGCDYKVTERWEQMDGLFSIYAEIEKVKP